jgi:hypothetical protein
MARSSRQPEKKPTWYDALEQAVGVFRAGFQQDPVGYVTQLRGPIARSLAPTPEQQLQLMLQLMHMAERTIMFYHLRPVTKKLDALNAYFVQEVGRLIDLGVEPQSDIAQRLGKFAFHLPQSPIVWLSVYRMVWGRLLTDENMRQAEYERLQTLVQKTSRDAELRQLETIASMHFLVLAGQEDDVFARIRAEKLKPALFFSYLEEYREAGDFAARGKWLEGLLRVMGGESAATVGAFLQEWAQVEAEREGWLEAAVQLLPVSLEELSGYYLAQGRYYDWADVYATLGLAPWDHDHTAYVTVHREQPEVLLPLYHQTIESLLASKSRNGYRDAVKWLKTIRAIYGRIGREAAWERFFTLFMERTGRLRAFQEELKLGGLAP